MALIVLLLVAQALSPQERLNQLRQELKEQRKKVEELKGKETGVLKNIDELDREISLTNKLVKELKKQEDNLTEESVYIENLIGKLDTRLRGKKEILKKRVVEIYKYGELHPLAIILLSYSFSDAIKRLKYLSLIAEQDRRVLTEIETLKSRLDQQRTLLQQKLADLEKIRDEAEAEEANLKLEREKKKNYLTKVKSKRKKAEKMAGEMKKAEKDLEKLIASLQKTQYKKGGEYFKNKRVRLPVKGKLVSRFGPRRDSKYGTITRNNGIDISAPIGEPVKVVAPGKVVFADHFLGYGKLVIVEHGGGYITLYAHLSAISVELGQEVQEGDVIGLVGDTGTINKPLLHFEVRKKGKPTDPMRYIGKV